MTDEYQYDNPNSKVVEYGGLALGGIILTLMVFFYPAVVLGVQAGLWGADSVGQFIVGMITLIAIAILWKIAVSVSNDPDSSDNENIAALICFVIVVGLYVVCLVPFCQWLHHVYTAEYISSAPDNFDKKPFTGFDWFWFIPSSGNQLWNWGILGEAIWDWVKMAFVIAVITYSICGVIILFSKMRNK